jgi:uncharacterized membrane protein YhfC
LAQEVFVNPLLIGTFIVAGLVDIVFPLLVGVWLARRFGVRWRVFWYGGLVFFLSQIVTRVPLVTLLGLAGQNVFTANPTNTYLYLGLLTFSAGAFEETGRWLGYRFLFKRDPRNWENALMYGAGHEFVESAVLVGLLGVIGGIVGYIAVVSMSPELLQTLPAAQQQAIEQARTQFLALQGWEPLLGAVERIATMAVQISLSVLVLQCFVRGSAIWLWIAIGWHTLVDFGAVGIKNWTDALGTTGLLITEGWVLLAALVGLGIIMAFRPRPISPAPDVRAATAMVV